MIDVLTIILFVSRNKWHFFFSETTKKAMESNGSPMDRHNNRLKYLGQKKSDQKKSWGGRILWGMVGQVGQADGVPRGKI